MRRFSPSYLSPFVPNNFDKFWMRLRLSSRFNGLSNFPDVSGWKATSYIPIIRVGSVISILNWFCKISIFRPEMTCLSADSLASGMSSTDLASSTKISVSRSHVKRKPYCINYKCMSCLSNACLLTSSTLITIFQSAELGLDWIVRQFVHCFCLLNFTSSGAVQSVPINRFGTVTFATESTSSDRH